MGRAKRVVTMLTATLPALGMPVQRKEIMVRQVEVGAGLVGPSAATFVSDCIGVGMQVGTCVRGIQKPCHKHLGHKQYVCLHAVPQTVKGFDQRTKTEPFQS